MLRCKQFQIKASTTLVKGEKMNRIKLLVSTLLLVCVLLSACAPAVPTVSPSINNMPTQISGTAFEGLSSGLDNAKQARLRTVSEVMGAPKTDVYINGLPAFNGGFAQQNIGDGQFSGWLYVTPGTYSVALVPHGGKLDQALFPPSDVKVEAGHRYTVAAMGQLADKDVHPLVVDETALEAGIGAKTTDDINIDINNLKGADAITEEEDGKPVGENIRYGEARAMIYKSGTPVFKSIVTGKTPGILYEGAGQCEPGASFIEPWYGPYPASNYDSVGEISQGTSELNVLDFLAGFKDRNVKINGHLATFNTLLAAIDKAGLGDQFANTDPNMLIAPTDAAFDGMPKDKRDALLNDPKALTQLLNAYIVDGYFPYGSFSGSNAYGNAARSVTNRLGLPLKFAGDFINGIPVGPNYTVGNGYRVWIIYTLLPVK
jgi:hypothetical protein